MYELDSLLQRWNRLDYSPETKFKKLLAQARWIENERKAAEHQVLQMTREIEALKEEKRAAEARLKACGDVLVRRSIENEDLAVYNERVTAGLKKFAHQLFSHKGNSLRSSCLVILADLLVTSGLPLDSEAYAKK